MKRGTAIFMLFLFIFSNTSLQELGKIGAFLEHFQEHKTIDSEITLLEFIQIHYFSGNIKDADYERDMQLPFKVISFAGPGVVCAVPPTSFLELPLPQLIDKKQIAPCDQFLLVSAHLSDIWQPPKYC